MRTALRLSASVAVTVVLWHLLLFLALSIAEHGDDWLDTGRVWPYRHAHLNEEYAEGAFRPLRDPMFLEWAGLRNGLAFAVGALVSSKLLKSSAHSLVLAAVHFTVSVVMLQAIAHGFRLPYITEAYLLEWLFAGLGMTLGLVAARSMGRKSSA